MRMWWTHLQFTNGNPLPISLATLYLAHWPFTSYALHVCIAYYHTHITLHFGSTHCAILVAQDVGGEVLVKRVAMQPPARTPCMWLQRGISGGKRPRSVNVLTSNQDPAVEQTWFSCVEQQCTSNFPTVSSLSLYFAWWAAMATPIEILSHTHCL